MSMLFFCACQKLAGDPKDLFIKDNMDRLKTAGDLGKDRHYRSKSQIKRLMVVVHKYKSKAGMYHVRKPSTKINTILVTLLLGFRVDADPAWVFAACQVRKQDDLHGFCMFSKSPICLFHYRKFTFA